MVERISVFLVVYVVVYEVIIVFCDWYDVEGDNGGYFVEVLDFVDFWLVYCVVGIEGVEYDLLLVMDIVMYYV